MDKENKTDPVEALRCETLFGVGRTITVKAGATRWMKERGFWLDDWPDSIDGMIMQIVADYTHLGGDSAHWWCENEIVKDCGVHPDLISPNGADHPRGEQP